jgi:hypothetical protein
MASESTMRSWAEKELTEEFLGKYLGFHHITKQNIKDFIKCIPLAELSNLYTTIELHGLTQGK